MERSILGVRRPDRIRNTTLRSKTRITDITEKVANLKWEWAGHVCRMHPERWAKATTEWVPLDSRRGRGRPKKRWRVDLDAFCTDWQGLALDRDLWKEKGEAFAQQWHNI